MERGGLLPDMKTICIKIGGATIDAPGLLRELSKSVAGLTSGERSGTFPVIVHGGGKDITRLLDSLNRKFAWVEGMRVTDAETVALVEMVLSGAVNKRIVNALQTEGVTAVGISGVDGNLFEASKLLMSGRDIGFVGTIDRVSCGIIDLFRERGIVPVVSPISRDAPGNTYNVNADLAASELAMAIRADDLVFVSDVAGVRIDGAVQAVIRIGEIEGLIASGQVTGGMVPKLRSAAEAVRRGVGRVHICGWGGVETLERELSGDGSGGTVIKE
jgi:acetylglutamate kinase